MSQIQARLGFVWLIELTATVALFYKAAFQHGDPWIVIVAAAVNVLLAEIVFRQK